MTSPKYPLAHVQALEAILRDIAFNAIAIDTLSMASMDHTDIELVHAAGRALSIMARHSGYLADVAHARINGKPSGIHADLQAWFLAPGAIVPSGAGERSNVDPA